MGFIDFECLVIMWLTSFSWNIILFYSLLERFRTSLQNFLITSHILHFGRVFNYAKLLSNLFLKTPSIEGRLVGRPCLVWSLLKILLNMCMKWVESNMSYTLDLLLCFQLVSLDLFNWYQYWHSFCILIYVCIYVCLYFK